MTIADIIGRAMQWLTSKPGIPEQPPLTIDTDGWLVGEGVTLVKSHHSWHGGTLTGGKPGGVVCHASDTAPGTALVMAKRRARQFGEDKNDRMASWHASVETDSQIVQMVSFQTIAWHAGSPSAKAIPGLGWANQHTNGIEIVGFEKGPFPDAQVWAYARLLRAIVQRYGVPREFAMVAHSSIDPARRSDPGAVWMSKHAAAVVEYAYR